MQKPVCLIIFLFASIFFVFQSAIATAENSRIEYRLGSGDEVRITVYGDGDLSGKFMIDGGGTLAFPLIGNIQAGGKTLRGLEELIVGLLKPDYLKNPKVSAEVLNYRPFYIIGEVKKPGSYPFVNGVTVVKAVAIAGGFTSRARENQLFVVRANDPDRKKEPVTQESLVLPGDVIEVPERFF